MTSLAFRPHGLIRDQIGQQLYHRAHIANFHSGIADPKEYETSALNGHILAAEFPASENFTVSPQYPPAPDSAQRIDHAVRYLESGDFGIKILVVVEDKRAKKSERFSLRGLEKQAQDYCVVCLESETDMPFVYAITAAGAHLRIWKYTREDELIPFWGEYEPGDWNQYKDVGIDVDAQLIRSSFEQMKVFPPTPRSGQSSHTYGTTGQSSYAAPLASASYSASLGSYQGYTVPVVKQDGGRFSSLSEKGSPRDESHGTSLPSNAIQVEVLNESKKDGDLYHFYHNNKHYTIGEKDWAVHTTEFDGAIYDCVAYGESGLWFWTWNLIDLQPYKEAVASSSDAAASNYLASASAQDSQQDPNFIIVTVRVVPHMTKKDEIVFTNARHTETRTERSQWDKIKYNGRTAWQYQAKRHTYICFDRAIGS